MPAAVRLAMDTLMRAQRWQCMYDRSPAAANNLVLTKSAIPPLEPNEHPMTASAGKRVLITGHRRASAPPRRGLAEKVCHLRLAPAAATICKALTERLRTAHQIDATAHVTVFAASPMTSARLGEGTPPTSTFLVNNGLRYSRRFDRQIDEATWRHHELKVFRLTQPDPAIYEGMKGTWRRRHRQRHRRAARNSTPTIIWRQRRQCPLMAFTQRARQPIASPDHIRVVGSIRAGRHRPSRSRY